MSTFDDDNIAFDFFDEPETVETTRRGRKARAPARGGDGPRRPPMRAPTGIVPLARLVGLIAIAIVVVVALVFWVGACQGKSKHDEYAGVREQGADDRAELEPARRPVREQADLRRA